MHDHVLDLCPGLRCVVDVGDEHQRYGADNLLVQFCDEEVHHGLRADDGDGFLSLRESRELSGVVELMVKLNKGAGVFFSSFTNDHVWHGNKYISRTPLQNVPAIP